VLLLIAWHPSRLAGGAWLSLCVLMIPTDPEAFGIPLYSLWWASLLLPVTLFWDQHAAHLPWRIGGIVLGGLSSPLILLAMPLFWVRAWLYRGLRREWLLAAAATLCFAVQLSVMIQARVGSRIPPFTLDAAIAVIENFFGYYLVGQARLLRAPWILAAAGAVLLVVTGTGLWRQRKTPAMWFLVYLWLGSIALSAARINAAVINPLHAGPHYFFFPYILLSWLLLQIALSPAGRPWLRRTALVMLAVAAVNALPHLSRWHDDLDWRRHVASSIHFDRYAIPIESDGAACRACYLNLRGTEAAALVPRDPLRAWGRNLAVYPYTAWEVNPDTPAPPHVASAAAVENNAWQDLTASAAAPAGFALFRSTGHSTLTLRLHRGDSVLFRTSLRAFELTATIAGGDDAWATKLPTTYAWKWLEFSNRRLPATFTVTLQNQGPDPQQWAEVGLVKGE